MDRIRARSRALHVTYALTALLAGCQDVTQPSRPSAGLRDGPSLDWTTPANGSASVSPVDQRYGNGTAAVWAQNLIYPVTTIVRVDVSGYVSQSSHYPLKTNSQLGPAGNAVVGVWYPGNYYVPYTLPGDPKESSAKMYITMNARGQIGTFGRSGYGNDTHAGTIGTDGSTVWCGPPYTTDYCYQYSGGSSFTVTPLVSTLQVDVDSSTLAAGHAAKLNITASPQQVEGNTMPVVLDSVGWTPDSGTTGTTATGGCTANAGPPITCSRVVTQSGTLHVIAHVNGARRTADKHITVQNPTLTLGASPSSVHRPTDTVTFTPSWSDGYQLDVRAWVWAADTGSDANTKGCEAGKPVCRTGVWKSGRMTVTVYREGQSYSATAPVRVTLCLTGDSLVDTPAVREAMWRSWAASGAETDTNPANRHENLFGVYQSPTTHADTVIQIPTPNATACEAGINGTVTVDTVLANGYKLKVTVHPHPVKYGTSWPSNCGGDYDGGKYEEPKIPGLRETGLGRGSSGDWDSSKQIHVPGVIVDFEQVTRIRGDSATKVDFGFSGVPFLINNGNDPNVRRDIPRNADSCPTH